MIPFVRAGAAVAATLVMLFGSTGCNSLLESCLDERTYVLESVGGKPLPTVVFESELYQVTVLADTFRFQPDGTGTSAYAHDVDYLKEPQRNGGTANGRRIGYQVKGEAIEIAHECGPLENCTPPPHWIGRVTSDALQLNGEPGPYVYRRVR